jgi:hypothetical protein
VATFKEDELGKKKPNLDNWGTESIEKSRSLLHTEINGEIIKKFDTHNTRELLAIFFDAAFIIQ